MRLDGTTATTHRGTADKMLHRLAWILALAALIAVAAGHP